MIVLIRYEVKNMVKKVREYIFITIGIIMVSIGIYFFLIPSNLATGGVTGLAIIIGKFVPSMPVGLLMLILNIVLFIIGFLIIGPSFGIKTIYASLGLSGLIWALPKFIPISRPIANDLMIELLFGVGISGLGMAIVFNQNASTGGTDIIAKIINKFFHVDMGKSLLMADFIITIVAGLTFGAKAGMYALLGVILNGFVIDSFINGLNISKQVTIISSKGLEIKDFIINKLERGVTIYDAKGAYSGQSKEVLITIMSRREFIKLKDFIKEIDNKAFITVSDVHEVLGEGFKKFIE